MSKETGADERTGPARVGGLVDRFLPASIVEGPPDAARRARLGVTFAWLSAAFFLFAATSQGAGHNDGAVAVDLLCALFNLLGPFVIRRTGRVAMVTHGVLAAVFGAVVSLAVLARGAGLNGATLMLTLIPLFATLILSVRAGAVWVGISLVSGVALGLLDHAGLIADQLPTPARLLNGHIVLALLTLVLFSVAVLFEIRKDEALRQISELSALRRTAELNELRAHTEAQLAEANQFAALGRIAAATAHEINNPLTFIIGNVELLAEGAAARGDADDQAALQDLLDGARRIQRIVRDMRQTSQSGSDAITSVMIADVLTAALAMAEPHISPRAHVRMSLEDVPPVAGKKTRLVQVFLNLLVNAAQAIPEGRAAEHEITVEIRGRDDRVIVEIRDTGTGLSQEPLAGATRRIGEGTGLGLALSEAVVRSIGGTLELESTPGRSVARLTLMVLLEPGKVAEPRPASPSPADGKRLQILVIDDEPLVASTLARMLAPHTVTIAPSGRQALARLGKGELFDLIFCDLMMPELTGMDVFEQLHALSPQSGERMVFMTGGTFTERAAKFRASVSNLFLEKPFDRNMVLEIVAARIRAAAEPGARGPTESRA